MDNQEDNLSNLHFVSGREDTVRQEERKKWPRLTRENALLAIHSFSKRQKTVFFALLSLCVLSGIGFFSKVNSHFLVDVPTEGGVLTEGIVGTPRFINPVLAVSDADNDLVSLVYSGLLRVSPDGTLIPDLAESYVLSEDGRTYTFTLKPHLVFHDGEPLTSEDISFTIEKVKDQNLRSPKRGNWDGVNVQTPDPRTIIFTLSGPYAPFLENTALGVLPAHLWRNLSTEEFGVSSLNMHPIGSGPYKVSEERLRESGIPEYYDLVPFEQFTLGSPYIELLRVRFYANEGDLLLGWEKGEVQSVAALSPETAEEMEKAGRRVEKSPLPRVFGVFFNQTVQEIFTEKAVREALDKSANKDYIMSNILRGQAIAISGPFPPGSLGWKGDEKFPLEESSSLGQAEGSRLTEARGILEAAGWTFNESSRVWEKKTKGEIRRLTFSLSTSDAPELRAAAESLKRDWEELGAVVELKIFEAGDLNQNVIRPRKYDALLFGEIVGRDPDPYAFWHSSQRLDPGLNIALYANIAVDKLLEKARETGDKEERKKIYEEFENEIAKDIPAVFLYSPQFLYALPEKVQNVALSSVIHSSERFSGIYAWHMETDRVWKAFVP